MSKKLISAKNDGKHVTDLNYQTPKKARDHALRAPKAVTPGLVIACSLGRIFISCEGAIQHMEDIDFSAFPISQV